MRGNERGPVAGQEAAVEQNFIARHPRARRGLGVATVGVLLGGGAAYGLAAYATEMNLASGSVKAERTALEPIELTCSAESIWKVNEAQFEYSATVKGKQIPQIGATIKYEDPTKITLQTCQEDASTYEKSVVIDKKDGKTIVSIPIDSIVTNIQIPTGNKKVDINQHAGLKIGGGLAGIASGTIQAACVAATLNQAGKECKTFAANIDDFKRDFDANSMTRADDALLESFRTEASVKDWDNTKLTIIDSYKEQAINKAGGDTSAADKVNVVFVDKSGNPTKEVPAFTDVFADMRAKGVLDPSDVTVAEKGKIRITLETPPYIPKHFDPRTEGVQ